MTDDELRRDVRTLLDSHDVPELGAAIVRLEYWLDETDLEADEPAATEAPCDPT